MSRPGRSVSAPTFPRTLRPAGPETSIEIYRLEDYTRIFSLYMNAVEATLVRAGVRAAAVTDDTRGDGPRTRPMWIKSCG